MVRISFLQAYANVRGLQIYTKPLYNDCGEQIGYRTHARCNYYGDYISAPLENFAALAVLNAYGLDHSENAHHPTTPRERKQYARAYSELIDYLITTYKNNKRQ